MIGGYQIITLNDFNFTPSNTTIKIKGIYDILENSRKAVLITGFTYDSIEYRGIFAGFEVINSNFSTIVDYSSNSFNITITDEDDVIVTKV